MAHEHRQMLRIAGWPTEALDQDIDSTKVDLFIVRPDDLEQLLTRVHALTIAQEMLQQPVLGWTERHRSAIPADSVSGGIELDAAVGQLPGEEVRRGSAK